MNREAVIQNVLSNYGIYGITRECIEPLIDEGINEGHSCEMIYLQIKIAISALIGEEFYCLSTEAARAFGVSDEEMERIIREAREELTAAGENPDDYFKPVERTIKFMVQKNR